MSSRQFGRNSCAKVAPDVPSDEGFSVIQAPEVGKRADALWRACPHSVKNGVKDVATLGGGQSDLGRFPTLSGKARGGKCLEWAL